MQRAVGVSCTTISQSPGHWDCSLCQNHSAIFSIVGFSNPSTSLRYALSNIFARVSTSALHWHPDEFVHLKLKTDVQLVRKDPFDDLTRVDPAKDGREEHCMAAGCEVVALHFIARPFVIFAGAHHEFHLVAHSEVVNVRPHVLVYFATAWCL